LNEILTLKNKTMNKQDVKPKIRYKNIFTGDEVIVSDVDSGKVYYEREKKHVIDGLIIKSHTKPLYQFAQTYMLV